MWKNLTAMAAASLLAQAPAAFASSLQCNKPQTKCLTESTDLTIGDRVGIFNDDNELVATGEVNAMKGDRRAVLISKRHGAIHKGYHLALLESQSTDANSVSTYKLYREPAKMEIGASLGYSTISIGQGSPATEFSAYGQMRKWGGLQLIGRVVYEAMEGEVNHNAGSGPETLPISMNGIGLLGGVGYIMRENQPLSFRGEAAVGGMQVSATVGGDKSLVDEDDTNAHVKNGFSPYARWSLGAIYNMDAWHLHLDFAESLVYSAFANTLAAGVSKDLK